MKLRKEKKSGKILKDFIKINMIEPKFIKKTVLIFSFFCLIESDICSENYITPTPGEISIVAWTPIPEGKKPRHKDFIDLIDCGFNLGIDNGSIQYFNEVFDSIGNSSFKYLISNSALFTKDRIRFIKAFRHNSHFAGWFLKDEPQFEELKLWSSRYRELLKEDFNSLIYMNLAYGIQKRFTGPLINYRNYLELIETEFNPKIWSYDMYPISIVNGKITIAYEQFYGALEDFAEIAKKTNKPFWAFCETLEYRTTKYLRPKATLPYLRFEAFSALAYGAQGIVYWTYGMINSTSTLDCLSALTDSNGEKTPAWFIAQQVNSEIKKFNKVFYNCKVLGVRHSGNQLYKGTKRYDEEFGPFNMVNSEGNGVIISLIQNHGKYYVIFVSRNVERKQEVLIKLKTNVNMKEITEEKKYFTWNKVVRFRLEEGSYKIFEIENYKYQ